MTALFNKSITPKPQSSKPRIAESSRSTAKRLKSITPKSSHLDPVKSKPKPKNLGRQLLGNSTQASAQNSAQNSAQIATPVLQPNAIATALRHQFNVNLRRLKGPPVRLINEIDDSSPPVSFTFINASIICEGVETVDEGFMSGCTCKQENGRNCGCEYRYCGCLQQSAKDENGDHHFPYSASTLKRGCLRTFYLDSRHHIYECNKNCNCRDNCKNKVVQHGRQVQLEIFKTENRGWGKLDFAVVIPNANDLKVCVVLRIFRRGNSSIPIVERSSPTMRLNDERKVAMWTKTITL